MTEIEDTNNSEDGVEKPDLVQQPTPKNKVQSIFHELEIMAMQKGGRNSLDLNRLSGEQIDKVLDTMAENEKNSFSYHSSKLEAIKEIELRKIDASVINQKDIKIFTNWLAAWRISCYHFDFIFQREVFYHMVNFSNWSFRRVWTEQTTC